MKPSEVIEAQRDLIERVEHDEIFRQSIGTFLLSEANEPDHDSRHWMIRDTPKLAANLSDHIGRIMRTAYAFQVTADMVPLILHAADGLDGTDQIRREFAPTGCGLVRFEKPIQFTDVRNRNMKLHWMLWGPAADRDGHPGLIAAMFNDAVEDPDEIQKIIMESHAGDYGWLVRHIGRWGMMALEFIPEGARVGPAILTPTTKKTAALAAEGIAAHSSPNLWRYMLALWLLLDQTIVSTREAEIPRSHRRWARRMNMPGSVTVIELRRFEGARAHGETMVEWSHRWVVRGHWRWQPCGEGRSERRRIWIAPFVKGPDDKPLVITEKVYRLAR